MGGAPALRRLQQTGLFGSGTGLGPEPGTYTYATAADLAATLVDTGALLNRDRCLPQHGAWKVDAMAQVAPYMRCQHVMTVCLSAGMGVWWRWRARHSVAALCTP